MGSKKLFQSEEEFKRNMMEIYVRQRSHPMPTPALQQFRESIRSNIWQLLTEEERLVVSVIES